MAEFAFYCDCGASIRASGPLTRATVGRFGEEHLSIGHKPTTRAKCAAARRKAEARLTQLVIDKRFDLLIEDSIANGKSQGGNR